MSDAISQRLMPGEHIIWTGRSARGLLFLSRDWLLIPFSVIWTSFAIFWEIGVTSHEQAPLFMKLWGLPFVLIGLYFVAGRFVVDAWIRRRTTYAFTNMRLFIVRTGLFANFSAVNLRQLPTATLHESARGTGTIRFGETVFFGTQASKGFGVWSPALDPTPQFIGIEDARSVFDQIQRAIRAAG